MNLDAPHRLAVEQALHALDSGHHGLGLAEVARRARQCGPNRLPRRPPPSLLAVLLRQLRDPMIMVLAIAALVATALSDWSDVAFIALVIVIDVVIVSRRIPLNRTSMSSSESIATPTFPTSPSDIGWSES